jgi:ribosome-associated protein
MGLFIGEFQRNLKEKGSNRKLSVFIATICGLFFQATMDSKKLALLCRELADNKKAEDVVILNVRELSSVTDYFVIASGTSEPHLRAIVDEITNQLREKHDERPRAIDGSLQTAWVVLDYFDVIVHVMRQDVRERYDLETLWGDAPKIKPKVRKIRTGK